MAQNSDTGYWRIIHHNSPGGARQSVLSVTALLLLQDLAGYVNEVKRDDENMQLISDVERRFSHLTYLLTQVLGDCL